MDNIESFRRRRADRLNQKKIDEFRIRRDARMQERSVQRDDDKWITVGAKSASKFTDENGREQTSPAVHGVHILLSESGVVKGGAGGKLNGQKFEDAVSLPPEEGLKKMAEKIENKLVEAPEEASEESKGKVIGSEESTASEAVTEPTAEETEKVVNAEIGEESKPEEKASEGKFEIDPEGDPEYTAKNWNAEMENMWASDVEEELNNVADGTFIALNNGEKYTKVNGSWALSKPDGEFAEVDSAKFAKELLNEGAKSVEMIPKEESSVEEPKESDVTSEDYINKQNDFVEALKGKDKDKIKESLENLPAGYKFMASNGGNVSYELTKKPNGEWISEMFKNGESVSKIDDAGIEFMSIMANGFSSQEWDVISGETGEVLFQKETEVLPADPEAVAKEYKYTGFNEESLKNAPEKSSITAVTENGEEIYTFTKGIDDKWTVKKETAWGEYEFKSKPDSEGVIWYLNDKGITDIVNSYTGEKLNESAEESVSEGESISESSNIGENAEIGFNEAYKNGVMDAIFKELDKSPEGTVIKGSQGMFDYVFVKENGNWNCKSSATDTGLQNKESVLDSDTLSTILSKSSMSGKGNFYVEQNESQMVSENVGSFANEGEGIYGSGMTAEFQKLKANKKNDPDYEESTKYFKEMPEGTIFGKDLKNSPNQELKDKYVETDGIKYYKKIGEDTYLMYVPEEKAWISTALGDEDFGINAHSENATFIGEVSDKTKALIGIENNKNVGNEKYKANLTSELKDLANEPSEKIKKYFMDMPVGTVFGKDYSDLDDDSMFKKKYEALGHVKYYKKVGDNKYEYFDPETNEWTPDGGNDVAMGANLQGSASNNIYFTGDVPDNLKSVLGIQENVQNISQNVSASESWGSKLAKANGKENVVLKNMLDEIPIGTEISANDGSNLWYYKKLEDGKWDQHIAGSTYEDTVGAISTNDVLGWVSKGYMKGDPIKNETTGETIASGYGIDTPQDIEGSSQNAKSVLTPESFKNLLVEYQNDPQKDDTLMVNALKNADVGSMLKGVKKGKVFEKESNGEWFVVYPDGTKSTLGFTDEEMMEDIKKMPEAVSFSDAKSSNSEAQTINETSAPKTSSGIDYNSIAENLGTYKNQSDPSSYKDELKSCEEGTVLTGTLGGQDVTFTKNGEGQGWSVSNGQNMSATSIANKVMSGNIKLSEMSYNGWSKDISGNSASESSQSFSMFNEKTSKVVNDLIQEYKGNSSKHVTKLKNQLAKADIGSSIDSGVSYVGKYEKIGADEWVKVYDDGTHSMSTYDSKQVADTMKSAAYWNNPVVFNGGFGVNKGGASKGVSNAKMPVAKSASGQTMTAEQKAYVPKNSYLGSLKTYDQSPKSQYSTTFDESSFSESEKHSTKYGLSQEVVEQSLMPTHKKAWGAMTSTEQNAIKGYTGNYHCVNEPLYGTKYSGPKDSNKQKIDAMTSGIAKSVIPNAMYGDHYCGQASFNGFCKAAGIEPTQLGANFDINAMIGKELVNTAFTSMGSNEGNGLGLSRALKLHIFCPKGTQAFFADPISQYHISNEFETILQRGTRFRVVGGNYKNGQVQLDVEVVEQDPKPFEWINGIAIYG